MCINLSKENSLPLLRKTEIASFEEVVAVQQAYPGTANKELQVQYSGDEHCSCKMTTTSSCTCTLYMIFLPKYYFLTAYM